MLIRSHEVKEEGYLVEHDGKCITVFSAPNYCDQVRAVAHAYGVRHTAYVGSSSARRRPALPRPNPAVPSVPSPPHLPPLLRSLYYSADGK